MQYDYINSTSDGKLSWKSASSCTSDSGEALENWKNWLHEVSMRRCARVTWSVRRMKHKLREIPTYEGFPNLVTIRGNLGSKMGLVRKCANNKFCELEFNNKKNLNKLSQP